MDDIIKTRITTTVGMSVLYGDDWVKTGHEIQQEVVATPTMERYGSIAKNQLAAALQSCGDQIDIIANQIATKAEKQCS